MRALIMHFVKAVLLLLVWSHSTSGNEQSMSPELAAKLAPRTHKTWEGVYTFSSVSVIRIEGLRNLYVIAYGCEGHQGVLLDFAIVDDDDELVFIQETHQEVKGVTPALEGIDVFPQKGSAEIIVRWRHPGQGGLRTVQKYLYKETTLELIDQADFVSAGRQMKWTKSESYTRW